MDQLIKWNKKEGRGRRVLVYLPATTIIIENPLGYLITITTTNNNNY
jgi:hypothetical protein